MHQHGGIMLKLKRIGILFTILAVMFAGCTRYANEEELQALENAKLAADKAQQKLENVKAERKSLEDELAQKQKELEDAKKEKATVEKRLENFNN